MQVAFNHAEIYQTHKRPSEKPSFRRPLVGATVIQSNIRIVCQTFGRLFRVEADGLRVGIEIVKQTLLQPLFFALPEFGSQQIAVVFEENLPHVGFAEQELNAHKGDFVLTPLADERVGQLRSAAQESVGEDTYKLYCDKIRETFYRAAQTEDALRVHPGVFVETNDPQEGERLALDAGYAKGFRERTYQHGLSSYTPNDEIGWRKADTEFAETTLKSSMESDPEAIERIDTLRASIADAIQRNSPYAAISQDRSYGKQLVQNAEKRASVRRLISEQKARAEERNTESAVAYSR